MKKLEELLNMPDSKEIVQKDKEQSAKAEKKHAIIEHEETQRNIAELDKISAALPQVKGLGEMADKELNEVANKAMSAYDDLMDLGMNVESRYASRVFEVAGGMLKTSLDAKTAKLDKKLKMIGFTSVKVDQEGYKPGKINVITYNTTSGGSITNNDTELEIIRVLN